MVPVARPNIGPVVYIPTFHCDVTDKSDRGSIERTFVFRFI